MYILYGEQKQRNERTKKKKAPKYEHRGQVVFTYLYFSHARIRAARICLINTFPACLSRGYSNFVRAGRGGNNVEISLRCSNIEKSFPFLLSPPLARIFQPITRDQKHKLQEGGEGGTNRPYGPDFYLRHQPRGINSRIYRCRTTLEYERGVHRDHGGVYVSRLSNTYNLFRLFRTLLRRGGWIQ